MIKKVLATLLIGVVGSGVLSAQNEEFTLDHLFTGMFFPNSIYGVMTMPNSSYYTKLSNNQILRYSFATGESDSVLADFGRMRGIMDYQLGKDGKILIIKNKSYIYRHSYTADYSIWDANTRMLLDLTDDSNVRNAEFSPDGFKVGYVSNNNLYIKDLNTSQKIQVTTDGKYNEIINGVPDWVYEEEFGINKAFEFSPDGKYLAYVKFDESQVKKYILQYFDAPSRADGELDFYPYEYEYKYPKVGFNNSVVSVHVYEIATGKTFTADIGSEKDIYIPKIQWTAKNNVLAISLMNRRQNQLNLLSYDLSTNETKSFFEMKDSRYIEVDVVKSVTYLPDGKSFIIKSEQDGYRHIYHYSMTGELINVVTKDNKDVLEILGFDKNKNTLYYTSVGDNATQTQVCSVDLKGKKPKVLSKQKGTNTAIFSDDFKYYINNYENTNTPYQITLNDISGKQLKVLEDNEAVSKNIDRFGGVHTEFFTWKNSKGDLLNAYITKPYDFDSTKKYPVLVVGYNGPNSNQVTDNFQVDWTQVLLQKGYLVVCTDTRGTGRRGTEFRKCTYGQLGKLETEDLADFSRYLSTVNYIDGERLGIWGWSYGGFMVTNLMTRAAGSYKLGIAVAPVTNWLFYDNIYTERYMGLVEDNYNGYVENSPLTYVKNLDGKFLLMFGSADDNVHPQNSMVLVRELVKNGKDFDMMQYTNCDHSIRGMSRYHLYEKAIKFVLNNL